ncbi:MAG: hypothetical protein JSR98_01280 [Proteobacteria bacterium]|nr:hypothetical protein [Pseudomonadota bacterium]
MTTVNYPTPVMVNGYSCKNCTQVDEAKKHIDPNHPQDGPFGVLANTQPPNPNDPHQTKSAPATGRAPAVTLGGALTGLGVSVVNGPQAPSGTSRLLDVRA